jgi:glutamine amidotransferase
MIGVIDYKAGNLRSVETALRFIGADFQVTNDPQRLMDFDKLIFPGVGEARSAMDELHSSGLDQGIREFFTSGKPMLGICIGCQIVLTRSDERDTPCLDLVPGIARSFSQEFAQRGIQGLKVPQIGWNQVHWNQENPSAVKLFAGIPQGRSFYFVHSYFPQPELADQSLCSTQYGLEFASGVSRENLAAVQFHPEKSGEYGLTLLSNFCGNAF